MVVPLVGTWIETTQTFKEEYYGRVVPLVGTWIETPKNIFHFCWLPVVPLVGTWIETTYMPNYTDTVTGRSPRGNVD